MVFSVAYSETAAKSESYSIEIDIVYTDCTADANADINLRVNKVCFIRVSKPTSKLFSILSCMSTLIVKRKSFFFKFAF